MDGKGGTRERQVGDLEEQKQVAGLQESYKTADQMLVKMMLTFKTCATQPSFSKPV
jgi:hypothetical protein